MKIYVKNCTICFLLSSVLSYAQIGINTESPHSSAALDIVSVNKGILTPRVSQSEINTITPAAESLFLYNTSSKGFEAFNGTIWSQQPFYPQSFWKIAGDVGTVDNISNIIGTTDARIFTVRTNNIKTFNIEANGQIRIGDRNLPHYRLYVKGPASNSPYSSIVALHSTGFGATTRFPLDIAVTNVGNTTFNGNYAFADNVLNAEVGNSSAGISYRSTGGTDEGFSIYTGGHPTSIQDNSLERMRITTSGNVGINTSQPVSKFQIEDGDVYIADSTKGIIINVSPTDCYRVTVTNAGTLATNLITCP